MKRFPSLNIYEYTRLEVVFNFSRYVLGGSSWKPFCASLIPTSRFATEEAAKKLSHLGCRACFLQTIRRPDVPLDPNGERFHPGFAEFIRRSLGYFWWYRCYRGAVRVLQQMLKIWVSRKNIDGFQLSKRSSIDPSFSRSFAARGRSTKL